MAARVAVVCRAGVWGFVAAEGKGGSQQRHLSPGGQNSCGAKTGTEAGAESLLSVPNGERRLDAGERSQSSTSSNQIRTGVPSLATN